MIDFHNLYFCEYSEKQNCFHVVDISKALEMNRNSIINGYGVDFIPFAIADDRVKANALCDKMQRLMEEGEE